VNAEWITSPAARRVLAYWADPRPAWLWSQDGATLIWRNSAARLFNAKIKKSGLKLSAPATPIKGLVSRLVRLGTVGRPSLSRVQFLAGDKPIATTCTCTPLPMLGDETGLLVVALDPIPADLREAAADLPPDSLGETLFPVGWSHDVTIGHPAPAEGILALKAGPADEILVLTAPPALVAPSIDDVRAEEGLDPAVVLPSKTDERDLADMPEPMLPLGLAPIDPLSAIVADNIDQWVDPLPESGDGSGQLSSLFDRLAGDADLYTPLTQADEDFHGDLPATDMPPPPVEVAAATPGEPDMIAAVIEYADDPEPEPSALPPTETRSHWLITGRGFRTIATPPEEEAPSDTDTPAESAAEAIAATDPEPQADPMVEPTLEGRQDLSSVSTVDEAPDLETAERVSRYNFEELGRILTDRVATESTQTEPAETDPLPAAAVSSPPPVAQPSGIINLNAETLVLNRLPLAILVFRDQQVLFANRALTDLLGHESVESLRAAGIASIFPSEDSASAGPVNRLVRRDGTPLNVTARLQSVSWQGRAALMLSASASEPMRGHEGAVRAFAEIAAETRGEGYLSADRAGIVGFVSAPGRALLGRSEAELAGKPLAILVAKPDMESLRIFLEKPARFAETSRPAFTGVSENGDADIVLFAEGQAGIVTGYFGFIRARIVVSPPVAEKDDELEPGMLGRLSRGIRRPLNTIIGFADLIRSAGGDGRNERAAEYARDNRTAGLEIAVLADELDDFTRLRDGRYAPRPSEVDLTSLLESCMVRVKSQAGAARVLVRSAISERLPRIRADRSSLGQALLNLLASAIDQTPVGGSVILSAQSEEDGGIAIHVRDGAQNGTELGERFVVFRDGIDKDGEQLAPVRSSVGLALTRSLLAVNACSLSVDPTVTTGTLFSLKIPAAAIVRD
jgi:PAS domain-containing protein/signal transduction histidine kinase